MIHLDTNFLIALTVPGSVLSTRVDGWLKTGESLAASSIAWAEFLNGPVSANEIVFVSSILQGRVVPFDTRTAEIAADLFNKTGRRRGTRFDCLIAATAIADNASLATENIGDFSPFVGHGLELQK